jgi:hypothetical protein
MWKTIVKSAALFLVAVLVFAAAARWVRPSLAPILTSLVLCSVGAALIWLAPAPDAPHLER